MGRVLYKKICVGGNTMIFRKEQNGSTINDENKSFTGFKEMSRFPLEDDGEREGTSILEKMEAAAKAERRL